MSKNNNSQTQPQAGPIAQQLAKIQSNGQQTANSGQQPSVKKSKWGLSDKSFWDWLQLLIVPIVLAIVTFGFGLEQSHISDINNQKQHDTDIQIATDQQQQALLQNYMDYITSLILGVNTGKDSPTLTNAKLGDEISQVARAQTLITVARLDSKRKGFLLRFLYDTKLINKSHALIDLNGADFSGADLSWVNLSGANLNGIDLSRASLESANLSEATLNGVTLDGANLRYANLVKASLTTFTVVVTDEKTITYTSLLNADLSVANLSETNLQDANLSGANLVQAHLGGANLSGANLKGAKYNTKAMEGKDVYGQSVTDEQGKPITVEPTYWNPDFNPRTAGAICVDC